MLDRMVLKENEIFAVTDREGNVLAQATDGQGLYYRDTRFLSVFELSIDHLPMQILASAGELNFMSNLQFGNLPTVLPDGTELAARLVSLRRNRFIDNGLHERIGLMNYGPTPLTLTLRLTFGSDFRDMFDVRGYVQRVKRGIVGEPEYHDGVIRLKYVGLDHVARTTEIRFDCKPEAVHIKHGRKQSALSVGELPSGLPMDPRMEPVGAPPLAEAVFEVELLPRRPWSLTLDIDPVIETERAPVVLFPSIEESFVKTYSTYQAWEASSTRIETNDEMLNALIKQSLHDLRLTINRVSTGLLPVAGIPWFSVPFGRDSLITSLQTLVLNPEIAYGTLRFLAHHQGTAFDEFRDEEPGKILHEVRSGEMAALNEVPQSPYYGSVDSTPLFVFVCSELLRWTNDWSLAEELRPNLERALEWIEQHGDLDGDGFVEYHSRSSRGIFNQGWKDSYDSVSFPDRRLAQPPIAMAEVQGYCYAAELRMAELYEHWGEPERAQRCRKFASRLKERFESSFWLEEEQFYAEALDGENVPVPAVTTNPAHCLLMGMLDGPRAEALVSRLLEEDMLCGWGLRTLSSEYPTFNPMSYHNGSIWPHDNSIVVAGLRRAGFHEAALKVIDQVLSAGTRLPGFRMPELFCGFSRDTRYHSLPAAYPVSCSPQAWAAGAVFLMLQHLVGLEPDLARKTLRISPALLPWLTELHLSNLAVGPRRLDITVWRSNGEIRSEVKGAEGLDLEVAPISAHAAGAGRGD